MARVVNDPYSIAPPITDIPLTLTPIRRGAVIDWKATAVQEHERHQQTISAATRRGELFDAMQQEIATLRQDLGDVLASNRRQEAIFRSIRAHWSSIFLPRHLR